MKTKTKRIELLPLKVSASPELKCVVHVIVFSPRIVSVCQSRNVSEDSKVGVDFTLPLSVMAAVSVVMPIVCT